MGNHIVVFGGDGFCGWPTSLGLSENGYDVTIVDNLSRRKIDVELECGSLTPIQPPSRRLEVWKEVSGRQIEFLNLDVARQYTELRSLIQDLKPRAVVHFAEQRAAPYSMKSPTHKRYTVSNNINATHNILCAISDAGIDVHVLHLGTMGVYGYDTGLSVPEGYLRVLAEDGNKQTELEILHPANPGSVYHMTKTLDALMFAYYNKNDGIRVTDLHQGIVWGTNTPATLEDEALINRFDYDGDYGTVLNRFLIQAAVDHPLTVHGSGGQTRAFINIRDTVNCIKLAIENPPEAGGRVEIFNQTTETHTVRDLAELVAEMTGSEVRYYNNPRNEVPENKLEVVNDKFLGLGLDPITLNAGLMTEIVETAVKYRDHCDRSKIISTSVWNRNIEVDREGSPRPVAREVGASPTDAPRRRCEERPPDLTT